VSAGGGEWDHRRAFRQRYPIENLSDQQVRLRCGEALAHHLLADS